VIYPGKAFLICECYQGIERSAPLVDSRNLSNPKGIGDASSLGFRSVDAGIWKNSSLHCRDSGIELALVASWDVAPAPECPASRGLSYFLNNRLAVAPIRMTAPMTAKFKELGMPRRFTRFCRT